MSDRVESGEFDSLYEALRRRACWGAADRRGSLNNITAEHIRNAAGEVRTGRTVSMAAPIETRASADNKTPTQHRMTGATETRMAATGLDFARDSFAMNIHGDADSHLDALCHVVYDAHLYNDVPAATLKSRGAEELSVGVAARRGIVGRGVLLDIPRARGVPWLQPGDHVTSDDLLHAEEAEGVHVGAGDLLFVRVGHRHRRRQLGPWDAATARAGLHPRALQFAADREVGVLGSDGNNDTAPAVTPGVAFPIHVLAVNALGLHLLDYLDFGDLRAACEQERRWSFLCVIAPLRLEEATGSPVNPIAIL